jgi:predicted RNA-binding Zn-ribbon protein involved in translation (DUF1610 family)
VTVVLRCPNCGTNGVKLGTCEACDEATLRFFCDNHKPGLWLAAARCPTCGDTFGARSEPRRATAPPPASRPAAPVRVPPAAVPAPPRAPRYEEYDPAPEAPVEGWQQLLAALLRSRTLPARTVPTRGPATVARGIGGCLMRLALLAFCALLALAFAVFYFGRTLFQGY